MVFTQKSETSAHDSMSRASTPLQSWSPCSDGGRAVELHNLNFKVRQVEIKFGHTQDIISRLKATKLGGLYARRIKRYVLAKWLVSWLWRMAYPIYINHIAIYLRNRQAMKWRALTKLSEFVKTKNIQITKLGNVVRIEAPVAKVYPPSDLFYLSPQNEHYQLPAVYVAEIKEGLIYGGTNLILTRNEVICHDLYDFERDYTSEELHGRTLISPRTKRIRWLLNDDSPERLSTAAAFVDACAINYAHWLTEVLPRIVAFCSEKKFNGIPIVVNSGLHQNIMESLFLVVGHDREIITLPIGRALHAEVLYLTSVAGYVPFDRRNKKLAGHSHGIFHPWALELLRNCIYAITDERSKLRWPEKIYLRRNSGARKVTNEAELEDILVSHGYVIVEPEKLTFLQQVQLFRNVKKVISPTGAALSNAIFCNRGTQVAVLMGKHESMIYRYWLNLLAPLQINVSYLLGAIVENHNFGIHGDFYIESQEIVELLKSWQTK